MRVSDTIMTFPKQGSHPYFGHVDTWTHWTHGYRLGRYKVKYRFCSTLPPHCLWHKTKETERITFFLLVTAKRAINRRQNRYKRSKK